jgi:peptide/nickel transport system permease protein
MTSEALAEFELETPVETSPPVRHPAQRRRWGLWIGATIVALYLLLAALGPLLAPYDPLRQDIPQLLRRPSLHHLLGTDALGRDVLSRLIYATRYDLLLAGCATALAMLAGVTIGLLAGYFRSVVDVALSRVVDLVLTLPTYPLLVLMLFAFGSGTPAVILAFAVTDWVGYARLTRAQVFVAREQEYVAAARLGALGHLRVMGRHVLPNVVTQILVLWASDIVIAIGTIAALGYLGIGIQAPTPEWGVMVVDGQDYLLTNWWLAVAPGVMIVILGVGLALVSDSVIARGRRG